MLGDGCLLPETGVSCSESCDFVLHPLDRFADELNKEDSFPVCYLPLPGTRRALPSDQKVYLEASNVSAHKKDTSK